MKVILLSNPSERYLVPLKKWIKQGMKKALDSRSRHRPLSVSPEDLLVITSRQAYDKASFKAFFNEDSGTYYVVVVPELNWDGPGGFEAGYEKALDLLGDKLGNKFFHLFFVSWLDRDRLFPLVGTAYQELVNTFPHYTLSSLSGHLLTKAYTRIHFDLIRRTAISKSGRINLIRHSLARLRDLSPETVRKELTHTLDILSLPVYMDKYGNQAKLESLKEQVRGLAEEDGIGDLLHDVGLLIDEIQDSLTPASEKKAKASYRVLIVEDDTGIRNRLVNLFSKFFYRVDAYSDQQIREVPRLLKGAMGQKDLIILDMMFCDPEKKDKTWLSFNGLDLYKTIKSADSVSGKKTAVRIITALPRNDLSHLAEKFKLPTPIVFTKGDGWEQLCGCLQDRMDDMIKECEENRTAMHSLDAPENGFFGEGRARIVFENPQRYQEALEYAEKVEAGEKMDPRLPSTKNQNNPKYLLAYLPQILAFRRLFIKYWVKNPEFDYEEDRDRYNQYIRRFLNRSTNNKGEEMDFCTKDRLTSLGFNKKDGCTRIEVCARNLFDEEKALLAPAEEAQHRFDAAVNKWVARLIGSFGDPRDAEYYDSESGLEDIYGADLMLTVFSRPNSVTVEAFTAFLDRSLDYVNHPDNPEDRDYILDRFFEDDNDLESSRNSSVQKRLRASYAGVYARYEALEESS
ncbi:MAG: response regulator transcription factor [Bacteroidales bacterium]|nr:response regulator transcription factor [Bacteroidales bacterium]